MANIAPERPLVFPDIHSEEDLNESVRERYGADAERSLAKRHSLLRQRKAVKERQLAGLNGQTERVVTAYDGSLQELDRKQTVMDKWRGADAPYPTGEMVPARVNPPGTTESETEPQPQTQSAQEKPKEHWLQTVAYAPFRAVGHAFYHYPVLSTIATVALVAAGAYATGWGNEIIAQIQSWVSSLGPGPLQDNLNDTLNVPVRPGTVPPSIPTTPPPMDPAGDFNFNRPG